MSLERKHGHFTFLKSEIVLHSIFLISTICIAFLQVMPEQVETYPPPDRILKESYLTSVLGRKRDAHDDQWEAFRSNIPVLLLFIFGWKYAIALFVQKERRPAWLRSFWLGLGLVIFSFRADVFLYLGLILGWYFMTKMIGKNKIVVPISWSIVIVTLYLNEQFDHFRFLSVWISKFVPNFLPFMKSQEAPILWTNILNMQFLKMLAFTMDYHWGDNTELFRKHCDKCEDCRIGQIGFEGEKELCYKGRDLCKLPQTTLRNYLDYMLFAPTILAGPPISFNSFFSFTSHPTHKQPPYLRTLLLLIFFEVYLHFYPIIPPQPSQSLLQMCLCSLLFLYFISLKFTLIWRIGRLWGLEYGIDLMDNMGRCMFNNYGFERFWRMWHKGFNHWLIRYLYVPLGGKNNLGSVVGVIVFVAFWHDHSIRIVVWALILVLFMVPELAIKSYFRKYHLSLYSSHIFKYICALACSVYIQVICYCNLIAFGYGLDNAWVVLRQVVEDPVSYLYMTLVLISACILMFYIREIERPTRND